MPYFSFILANAKIFWGHHSVNMILVTSVILQLSSFLSGLSEGWYYYTDVLYRFRAIFKY